MQSKARVHLQCPSPTHRLPRKSGLRRVGVSAFSPPHARRATDGRRCSIDRIDRFVAKMAVGKALFAWPIAVGGCHSAAVGTAVGGVPSASTALFFRVRRCGPARLSGIGSYGTVGASSRFADPSDLTLRIIRRTLPNAACSTVDSLCHTLPIPQHICLCGISIHLGVLILRRLRRTLQRTLQRAIWVIILEQRQHSGTYACVFLCNTYPYTPFFPHFCYYFHLFGPLPPTNGAFVARPQYGMGRV